MRGSLLTVPKTSVFYAENRRKIGTGNFHYRTLFSSVWYISQLRSHRPMSKSQKKPIVKPATRERGEARYFHGRVKILDDFKELLGRAKAGNSGTSILIQAAPGAGKTALLHKCAQIARAQRWQTAEIDPDELYDPAELSKSLRLPLPAKRQETKTGGNVKVLHRESTSEHYLPTTLDILESGRKPLLLLLDEAQTTATVIPRSNHEQFKSALKLVKAIHNGKVGRPVILIAAGLGATAAAFDSLGISRFDPGCHINLGQLSKGSRRAVIEDWLKLEGRAKGDPTPWIDALAHETHGWPQHIMAYVRPALKQLKLTEGELTPEGLKTVLKEGRKGRIEFYEARTQGLFKKERQCIARAVAGMEPSENIDKDTIITSLRKEFSEDEAEVIFRRALHKGVLDARGDSYVIPIPSMHNWLVSNYALELKRMPKFNWYLVARMTNSEIKARTDECTFNEDPAILLPQLTSDALKRLPPPLGEQEWVFDAVDVDTQDVIWTVAGHDKTVGHSDNPFDPPPGEFPLGHSPDPDRDIER